MMSNKTVISVNKLGKIRFALGLGLLILSLLLSGCSGPAGQPAASGNTGETIPVYTIADPAGDWGLPSPWGHYQRGPGYIRMSLIFDTLIWKDEKGLVPALASEWSYDQTAKTYTFTLKDGVLWHDGQKLTAADIVFTFDYMKKHPYPWGDLSSVAQVSAEGDKTVKITLNSDYAPFLSNVAATAPIIPKHIWEKVEDPAQFTELPAVIGSGPFKYVDYNKEQGTYLYQANEQYYAGKVRVQELKFIKANPQMAAASLSKGEVNATAIQPEMAGQLKDKYTVIQESGSSNVKLMFNHQKGPFSSREFRQALAYALNRDELVAKALRGYGAIGNPGIYAPGNQWYNADVAQYDQNLQKMQALLTQLGYKLVTAQDGKENGYWTKNGQEVKLRLLCEPTIVRAAEVVKEQLGKAGFQTEIQSMETKVRDSKILTWDFDLALNSHGGLGGDPESLNKFILANDFNSARYNNNQQLNDLIAKQKSAMNTGERKEIVGQIQKLYADELPVLTLYYPNSYWAHDGKIPLFYTGEGIAIGVPIPLNKLSFFH